MEDKQSLRSSDLDFLKIAKQAALEAGKIIQKYSGKDQYKNVKHEDPTDYATEADIEAEKTIVKILTTNFPTHNLVAEEEAKINKKSDFTWVVDPLDGTISFGSGIPYFSVSIGLLEEGVPILGVIYNVSFKQLYWAEKGRGAYLNGKAIRVSKKKSLKESVGVLDFGHNVKRQYKLDLYVNKIITKIGYIYSFGSAVASLGLVAEGILDLDVNHAYPWDFVAGAVIVREAGGKVTDFEGQEPDWTKERLNIIASNGLLHEQILEALKP
ncbi:MAG: inositol monophosphatase family protein [Candidatus Daviesbacteria bacterium]|nr:inositol monophosphatase family protein [Candidatus Daviesbacteria bacterium]